MADVASLRTLVDKGIQRNPLLQVLGALKPDKTQKFFDKLAELDRKWQLLDPQFRADVMGLVSRKAQFDLAMGMQLLRNVKGSASQQRQILQTARDEYHAASEDLNKTPDPTGPDPDEGSLVGHSDDDRMDYPNDPSAAPSSGTSSRRAGSASRGWRLSGLPHRHESRSPTGSATPLRHAASRRCRLVA